MAIFLAILFLGDVRATLEAEGGALGYLTLGGVIDCGADGYQQLLAGALLPDGTPIRWTL